MEKCLHKIYNELNDGKKYMSENPYNITNISIHDESILHTYLHDDDVIPPTIKSNILNRSSNLLTTTIKILERSDILDL